MTKTDKKLTMSSKPSYNELWTENEALKRQVAELKARLERYEPRKQPRL